MRQPDAADGASVAEIWLADHPFFSGFLDPLKRRAEEFNRAHPGCRVQVEGHDFRLLPGLVAKAAAEGRAPAAVEYYATASQLARDTVDGAGRPLFTSFEGAIGGRAEVLGEPVRTGDLLPAVADYYRYGGELVSVPVTATTPVLVANTTLLDRAGVAGLPRTWDEVDAACAALTRLAGGPPAGITWPNHGWLFQQAVAEQGGLLADAANGRSGRATTVRLDSPELLGYVEWWRRLHADGHYLSTGAERDWGGSTEAFLQQRVAFTIASSVQTGMLVDAGQQAGFAVAAGRLPYDGRVPYAGNVLSGQSFWLTGDLDDTVRDIAVAYVLSLLEPDQVADWHRGTGFVPVTGAGQARLEEQGWFAEHPQLRAAGDQLAASDRTPAALGPVVGDLAGIQDVLTAAMADVFGGAEPAARFARATEEGQRLLDDHNAASLAEPRRTPTRLEVG